MKKASVVRILENIHIFDVADKGKAVGRHEGQIVFVEGAVPGDIVDVEVKKRKSGYYEGKVHAFKMYSSDRVKAVCQHFGICGGCKWQHLDYAAQLRFKQTTVENALLRIAKVNVGEMRPILGAKTIYNYRNKLEFTFCDKRWLTEEEIKSDEKMDDRRGLGFHLSGLFDKILDLEECHLQAAPSDALRLAIRQFTLENKYSYYNVREHHGLMRTLLVRTSSVGELMVTLVFGEKEMDKIEPLLVWLLKEFPQITSLNYVINTKQNDTIYDLNVETYHGNPYIIERLGDIRYKISPKSFFQTNTEQALVLYQTTAEFAGLTGTENVWDLYTGTGSIACFVAAKARQVIGIEEVEAAIEDAKENALLNHIGNTHFYAGDVRKVFTETLIEKHGLPDVVITDPPRAGMHEDVLKVLLQIEPKRIVYVSCNPATQARDIALLSEKYEVLKSQAVDMFPHTHHIENIVLMEKVTK